MPTISWTSAVSGDWSVGSNWQGGIGPGAADDVVMNITPAETITVSDAEHVHSIAMTDPAATFVIANGGTLAVDGDVSLTMGTILVIGTIASAGTISLTAPTFTTSGSTAAVGAQVLNLVTLVGGGGPVQVGTTTASGVITAGGTITLAPPRVLPVAVPCFAEGTIIETDTGYRPVEDLDIGDQLRLVSGKTAPVAWIGRRTVDCRRHPAPERVRPIRVAPHAFGDNRPARPLMLSPDHAVFVEDVLIPIKFLVNDATITQMVVPTVTYFHIELPHHDVILAEGLPTESYLETGGRAAFENGGETVQLHADFTPDESRVAMVWASFGYAPLLGRDGQLDRVRARLAVQARMLAERSRAA